MPGRRGPAPPRRPGQAYSLVQAAEALGFGEGTVRRLCERGRLAAKRFGDRGRWRIDESALRAFAADVLGTELAGIPVAEPARLAAATTPGDLEDPPDMWPDNRRRLG